MHAQSIDAGLSFLSHVEAAWEHGQCVLHACHQAYMSTLSVILQAALSNKKHLNLLHTYSIQPVKIWPQIFHSEIDTGIPAEFDNFYAQSTYVVSCGFDYIIL